MASPSGGPNGSTTSPGTRSAYPIPSVPAQHPPVSAADLSPEGLWWRVSAAGVEPTLLPRAGMSRVAPPLAGRQTPTSAAASSGEAAAARRGRTPASSSPAGSEGHRRGRRTASARHARSGDAARVVTQRQNSARFLRSPRLLRSAVRCAPRSHSVLRPGLWVGRTPGAGPGA
jgi:hypothetical protein